MHQFHTFDKEIYLSFSTKSIPKESEVASVILFHLLGWNRKSTKSVTGTLLMGANINWVENTKITLQRYWAWRPPRGRWQSWRQQTQCSSKVVQSWQKWQKTALLGNWPCDFEGNTREKLILGVWDGYFWISTLVEFHYLRFLWYFDSSRKWKSAEQQLKLLLQSIIIYLVPD